jgi:hypothetical protein
MLQHQSFAPEDVQAQAAVRMLVESLMQRIQLWEMECTKDPQAAAVAYQAMSGEK